MVKNVSNRKETAIAMPNVMDYLEWRGDLTFTEAPICEVDNLIFCLLA